MTCVAVAAGLFSWVMTAIGLGLLFWLLFGPSYFYNEVVAPLGGIAVGVYVYFATRRLLRARKAAREALQELDES